MFTQMKWEEVYALWNSIDSPMLKEVLTPVIPESVSVINPRDESSVYGIDWLNNKTLNSRKKRFEKEIFEVVMMFESPPIEGVIKTAKMLIYAQSEEEIAAIWIAAICTSICASRDYRSPLYINAFLFYNAAISFLAGKFELWHHKSKNPIPFQVANWEDYQNDIYNDKQAVMNFIFKNILEIKSNFTIAEYYSFDKEKLYTVRKDCDTHL